MVIIGLLVAILLVNVTFVVIWYYRKTKTLEYRVHRFLKKERVRLRNPLAKGKALHEDALLQIFLRCGNEDWRDVLRKEYHREIVLCIFDKELSKDDGKYLINPKSKFITKDAPKYVPIEEDPDLIEL